MLDAMEEQGQHQHPDTPRQGGLPAWWGRIDAQQKMLAMEILAVLCVGVFPHLMNALRGLMSPPKELETEGDWPLSTAIYSLLIVVPVLWIMRCSRVNWRYYGVVKPLWALDVATGIGLVGVTFAAYWVFRAVAVTLSWIVPGMSELLEIVGPELRHHGSAPADGHGWLLLILVMLASALAEEVVCRGYLIRRLTDLTGNRWTGIVGSAAFFGSYHIYQGSFSALSVMFLGVVMGALFVWVGRLWPFVLGHAAYNVVNAALWAMSSGA